MIDISFSSQAMKDICNSGNKLEAVYGPPKARRILQRLGELHAAQNLSDFFYQFGSNRWQHLHSSQFFLFTMHPFGIVIEATNLVEIDWAIKTNDWTQVTKINVIDLDKKHDA